MNAVKMNNEKYTYEMFHPNELVTIFQEQWPDLVLVGNILTDPPQIIGIYKRFLLHYGVSLERIDMQLFPMDYAVHDGHDLENNNIYHFLNRLAPFLRLHDFCPTDVLMPSPKRARRVLSGIANFLLFTKTNSREEFVQEVNEEHKKSRNLHQQRLTEIEQLNKLKNQYLIQREENEAHERRADDLLEEHVRHMQEVKELKTHYQKELARKTEATAELEHAVQEENAKANKLAQEEDEYKKLIVKSPEGVQAEKKQAQDDLEKARERQDRIVLNEAHHKKTQVVLDELCEELPFISRVRDELNACRETSKHLDKIRLESANMKDQLDKKLNDLQSQKDDFFEREKNMEARISRLNNEKKACTEELERLESALAEKSNSYAQLCQRLEEGNEQIKQIEKRLNEMETKEQAALKKAKEEKNACIAEADRFDGEVLKMSQSLAKHKKKLDDLTSKFN